MIHASLFTGIGGFDLAAEWCGWQNSFQCEINDFCQLVLAKNFPHADRHTDIKGFDARRYRGTVDVLSGGFPCQPFSLAGQRKGNSDDRALWPQMLRIIDEVLPSWIVGENVAGLASLGLDGVLFDLEASGYACETVLLPACSVGAPHRRDRLWIIAHATGTLSQRAARAGLAGRHEAWACTGGYGALTADANHQRREECQLAGEPAQPGRAGRFDTTRGAVANALRNVPHGVCNTAQQAGRAQSATESWRLTEPPLRSANDGLPAGMVRVSTRAKQLKAYGNSIVPQVAYEIFQAINQIEA